MIAISLFLFWAFDVTTYSNISKYQEALDARHKTLEERQAILGRIEELYQEYQRRSSDVRLLSFAVPTKKDLANLIVSLDTMAQQSGILLKDISLIENSGGPIDSSQAAQVGISITTEGTYNSMLSFLSKLEENIRIIDVSSIDIKASQTGTILVTLTANTYFLR